MRNWILIIIGLFLFQVNSFAQDKDVAFLTLLENGKAAFESGNYDTCISCYEKAEKYQPNNAWLKYAAARCYDLKKKKKKAYQSLTEAIQLDWEDVDEWLANSESDFKNLKKKKRCWKKVQKEFKAQQKGMDLTLREELLQMEKIRQEFETELSEFKKNRKINSPEYLKLIKKQSKGRKENLKKAKEIIEKYGYPSKKVVGKKAIKTIFNITRQKKYVSLYKEAVLKEDLEMKDLAPLLDEIEKMEGRPQIYGTQLMKNDKSGLLDFYDILDEKKVNKRRAHIGLPTIESYAKRFDFEYQFKQQEYKKSDYKKFKGGWDLVNIRDAETLEITFLPQQNFWVEFLVKGRLRFNRTVNVCEMKYQATDRGRLVFAPTLNCTKKCCDDKEISRNLNYHDVIEFELYNNVLFLIDTKGKLWEFKRKKYKKQRMKIEDN